MPKRFTYLYTDPLKRREANLGHDESFTGSYTDPINKMIESLS